MFSVASYNIRKSVGTDWRRKPDRVMAVLRELDANVVALQEVDRRFGERTSSLSASDIAAETPYRVINFGARPGSLGWHGNTILVRSGVTVLHTEPLHLPALEPRGAALADLRLGGRAVRIVGMHLGLVSLWRKRQAVAVLQRLKTLEDPLPTVMMGDLNQWAIEGGCLAHFAEEHHVVEPGPSFHSHWPVASFDRIITSVDIDVEAAGVHHSLQARYASDHLPVWAKLRFAGDDAIQKRHEVAKSSSS